MSKLISTDKEYAAWVADLKHRFRSAQIKAAVKVNRELLIYYRPAWARYGKYEY